MPPVGAGPWAGGLCQKTNRVSEVIINAAGKRLKQKTRTVGFDDTELKPGKKQQSTTIHTPLLQASHAKPKSCEQ